MPVTGLENTMTGTILRLGERKQELADRAQEYDRALRQSQHAAATRRRHPAGSASVMAGSGSGGASSSIWHSGVGGIGMAQTAVLGDSHGSEGLPPPPPNDPLSQDEDLAEGADVGSELGDSYVDGKQAKVSASQHEGGDDEEGLEDGGVLGLLAQIYGAKNQGPSRVI